MGVAMSDPTEVNLDKSSDSTPTPPLPPTPPPVQVVSDGAGLMGNVIYTAMVTVVVVALITIGLYWGLTSDVKSGIVTKDAVAKEKAHTAPFPGVIEADKELERRNGQGK
jgi:hypothetical protein